MHFKTCEAVAHRIEQLLKQSETWEQIQEKGQAFRREYEGTEKCASCRRRLVDVIERTQADWRQYQREGWPFILVKEMQLGEEFIPHPYFPWLIVPIEINHTEIDISPWIHQEVIPKQGEIFLPADMRPLEGLSLTEMRTYIQNHTVPLTLFSGLTYLLIAGFFYLTLPFRWIYTNIKRLAK